MKYVWNLFIIIGTIGLVLSISHFESNTYTLLEYRSTFGIEKPYDIVGAISAGMIVCGFLFRKK